MKLSVISSLALATAMLMSTGVYAQDATTTAAPTMIGGQTVSAEDLPEVQAQCNTLAGVANQSMAEETPSTENGGEADGTSVGGESDDASDSSEGVANGTDQAVTTVDLSLITIEECKAAGLAQ